MEVIFYAPELSCGGLISKSDAEWNIRIFIDEDDVMLLTFYLN